MSRYQPPESRAAKEAPHRNAVDDMELAGVEGEEVERDTGTNAVGDEKDADWETLARDAVQFATNYMDANYRKRWEDGIRAFQSVHPNDSKYNHPAYDKRSKVYRPKTRAAIRKNEAAAVAAFFSSWDVVNVAPVLESDPMQRASAEIHKQLLQYRMTTADARVAIPWFLTCIGALQSAQTVGVVVSRQYWHYDEQRGTDKPCVRLVPPENFLFDPSADWTDPVGTSPYLVELIPMYVGDVRARMDSGEWNHHELGDILEATDYRNDTTRQTRLKRVDPTQSYDHEISDYETVWVRRHIHRKQGDDYVWYMLGNVGMLTEPKPLKEEVFTGERDYVIGYSILEAFNCAPPGIPELSKQIQDEINEVTNQSLDNTKFVLNKRWFVKRGKNVDVSSLVRNVPGGVTMCDDPENDAKEVNWPDITPSAFEQQNRLNADFSDLVGESNPFQNQIATKGAQQPAATMAMLANAPSSVQDYLLHTFLQTWVQPVLRQLVKLEQKYETDETVLAIAADKAKLRQKFGIDQVTDELLNKDLTLTVNLVFGAMTPIAKLQRLNMGLMGLANLAKSPLPGINMGEVAKESFSLMGYQDGARFMQQDAETARMAQALQLKDQTIQELMRRLNDKQAERSSKEKIAEGKNRTAIATTVLKQEHENRHKAIDVFAELAKPEPQPAKNAG